MCVRGCVHASACVFVHVRVPAMISKTGQKHGGQLETKSFRWPNMTYIYIYKHI